MEYNSLHYRTVLSRSRWDHPAKYDVLVELGVSRVDFLKLDVEGAEFSVLYGVMKLLHGKSRPTILAEVRYTRTQPLAYTAQEILQFLIRMDRWFAIAA